MRRRRIARAVVVVTMLAVPTANVATAHAAERPVLPPELSRCDIAADVSGVRVQVRTVTHDLATGRDGGGSALLPYGTVDDTWTVPAKTPDDAFTIAKHAAWVAPPTNTTWINARNTYASGGEAGPLTFELAPVETAVIALPGTGPTALLPSKTTFRAEFTIPNDSFLERLDLSYAADNGVTFHLNGVPIGGFDPTPADVAAFTQMHPLVYTGPLLRAGVNVLDAVVTDYGVATGLLVTGGYNGCQLLGYERGACVEIVGDRIVASMPRPIDLSTGSQNGVRDAYGAVDTKWHSKTNWTFPNAYSVQPYPGWYNALTTANWIHETPNPSTGSLGTVRTYVYEVEFQVGPGATYQDIDLRWAADDTARFFLNGVPLVTAGSFQTLTPLYWAGTFNVGTNVLRAEVTDTHLVASGLLVQGAAHVCYGRTTA